MQDNEQNVGQEANENIVSHNAPPAPKPLPESKDVYPANVRLSGKYKTQYDEDKNPIPGTGPVAVDGIVMIGPHMVSLGGEDEQLAGWYDVNGALLVNQYYPMYKHATDKGRTEAQEKE